MTHLYLVRHAQTEYNRRGIVQGQGIDAPINERGREQARLLASRLREIEFAGLYASALKRSIQTGRIVAEHHPSSPAVRTESDLNEISWGVMEGRGQDPEVDRTMRSIKRAWREGEYHRRLEDGESAEEVRQRGVRAVTDIADRHERSTAVAVVHGRFLRIVLASLLGYGLERMHEIDHQNTGVNHLVYDGDSFEARLLNCVHHLDEAESIATG